MNSINYLDFKKTVLGEITKIIEKNDIFNPKLENNVKKIKI